MLSLARYVYFDYNCINSNIYFLLQTCEDVRKYSDVKIISVIHGGIKLILKLHYQFTCLDLKFLRLDPFNRHQASNHITVK